MRMSYQFWIVGSLYYLASSKKNRLGRSPQIPNRKTSTERQERNLITIVVSER